MKYQQISSKITIMKTTLYFVLIFTNTIVFSQEWLKNYLKTNLTVNKLLRFSTSLLYNNSIGILKSTD